MIEEEKANKSGMVFHNMEYSGMKSLEKALNILRLFLENRKEMTLAEISRLSRLNKTTVHRIVSTLVKYGYLNHPLKKGAYSLGTIYFNFRGVIKSRLHIRTIALPHLVDLSQRVDEPVIIAFVSEDGMVYTETFHGESRQNKLLTIGDDEGSGAPLHSTCSGRIILVDIPLEELQRYYENNGIRRYTPNTIINIEEMKDCLVKIRREGIAFDDEELALGIRGVAAEIRGSEGKLQGAIGIVAPSVRLSHPKMRQLVPELKKRAKKVSGDLGFRGKTYS